MRILSAIRSSSRVPNRGRRNEQRHTCGFEQLEDRTLLAGSFFQTEAATVDVKAVGLNPARRSS